ncbi:uncharacterized protein MONBRDRAFT_18537 [Monosiga brevicollis MX1]|uniref:DNA-directed RNA polymerase subunit n=1 Tax=Monosiga brevicollis TaxID=81824 RepID=A9UWA6_MONBE|nr:uncharacterized protein MONBRDRAFT_18537 [Monosiga brevicollis MX1]EDQ90733.1 predicted protein [Monosiga brevicollis MX1]|eukprot:XP_001744784.1 hypothetical protein [Monosiga brevicollis MX1]
MIFCPLCGNMLIMQSSLHGYFFGCNTCPYKHELGEHRVTARRSMHHDERADEIYGGDSAKEMMDMTEADCPKCHHNRASYVQQQTRSADEPSTVFYCCEKCNHKWNDGS